jgi:hypothetical protein
MHVEENFFFLSNYIVNMQTGQRNKLTVSCRSSKRSQLYKAESTTEKTGDENPWPSTMFEMPPHKGSHHPEGASAALLCIFIT